jgi:hypothetical protein
LAITRAALAKRSEAKRNLVGHQRRNDTLPDEDFMKLRTEVAQSIRDQVALEWMRLKRGEGSHDRTLSETIRYIWNRRAALYAAWHPQREGEPREKYEERIRDEVIPLQMAEYMVLGKFLSAESKNSIILAYDSPIIGESYAFVGAPVLYGGSKAARGYTGA